MCARDFRRPRSAHRVQRRLPPRNDRRTGTGCTSSPSICRARRFSPGTTHSTWRTSSSRSATVSSTAPADARRAAVLGSPIAHSRSPQLHLAAYRALGLNDWTYDRIECTADELATLVGGLGPEWVGLSVTMPDKFAALAFADERTARAELVGSANTLLRTATGWRADNTDVDGVTGALRQERSDSGFGTGRAAVLGSGGTAPAALVGLVELGIAHVSVVARNPERAAPLLRLGNRLGVDARWVELGTPLAG